MFIVNGWIDVALAAQEFYAVPETQQAGDVRRNK